MRELIRSRKNALMSRANCVIAAWIVLAVSAFGAPVDYARDVQPILKKHCYSCHGPQEQDSGYRLDVRDVALKGGGSGEPAIVPHDAKSSPLFQRVSSPDEDTRMPPKDSGKPPLSADELKTLKAWIEEGPVWPSEHAGDVAEAKPLWSLAPLLKPDVPKAGSANAAHPIDAFVRAKLSAHGLAPSNSADRRTLLRRLSYDLTGLPPTEEELAAFVADDSPMAYESVVARLLASPRYGEHWARHWLDVANYADTHGNDHDYARFNAWPYRDYVIRSLNEDKPYARFIKEQIAGDALFSDDPQATVALGFLAAGPWDHTLMVTVREDTVDHRSAQNLDRDSMVSAAIGTFQSLTVHCARCHNHKFDPITQREYYSLQAVFAGVDRADRPFDTDSQTHRARTKLLAERRAIDHREAPLLELLETPAVSEKVAAFETAWKRREEAWKPLDVVSIVSTGGATFTRQDDGSWFVSGERPQHDTYIVTARRDAGKLSALRLEVLADDRLPQRGPGRWDNGNFHLTEFRAFAANGNSAGAKPILFASASADHDEAPTISAAQAIDGKTETQWGVHPRYSESHEAVFVVKEPQEHPAGTTFTVLLEHHGGAPGHGIGRFRISASDANPATTTFHRLPGGVQAILLVPAGERSVEQRRELALSVLSAENAAAIAALPAPQYVYAATRDFVPDGPNFTPSYKPRPIHLLLRGDLARPGELVFPGTLSALPGMPSQLAVADLKEESLRRAALANWLADERNVLTWRSIVNRVWSYHFGRGICDTPNDFGRMGGTPSHPELLDWLAVWFRDEAKGSLKELHRLIVTSETWKQSTLADRNMADGSLVERGAAVDADNRLLWRQNRSRLSGEQMRDTLLALSGKLDLTAGGPAAVQFISRGDATFNPGGNPAFLDYAQFDPDAPASRRRAIYRFLFRTVPDPFMDALDVPDGGTVTAVRGASTTAVQAFAMLNDAFVIRQCEHIAARVAARTSDPAEQTDAAFELILMRPPTDAERSKMSAYVARHGLANACQVIVNSNEFLYVD
jgi:mono/diheme cytochrome c family protein